MKVKLEKIPRSIHLIPGSGHRPGPKMLALAYTGLVLLGGTAVVYIVSRLM